MFFSSENMKALAMIIILRLTRTISGDESVENFNFVFDLTCGSMLLVSFYKSYVLQAHHL